jgi:hypothetical protein
MGWSGWEEFRNLTPNDKTNCTEAFCVVRVPTEAQEQARSRSRQRESLQKEKQRLAAQGRSHALYYGAHPEGVWRGAGVVPMWVDPHGNHTGVAPGSHRSRTVEGPGRHNRGRDRFSGACADSSARYHGGVKNCCALTHFGASDRAGSAFVRSRRPRCFGSRGNCS